MNSNRFGFPRSFHSGPCKDTTVDNRLPAVPRFMGPVFVLMVCFLLAPGCAAFAGSSADEPSNTLAIPADYVSGSFIRYHLEVLAHDSLGGRGTGQEGSRMAADHIYRFYSNSSFDVFDDMELIRQSFTMEGRFWDSVEYSVYRTDGDDSVSVSYSVLEKGSNANFYPISGGMQDVDAPIVFAGYGSDVLLHMVNDEHDMLKDAWVMIFDHPDAGKESFDGRYGDTGLDRTTMIRMIRGRLGAAGVIFITGKNPDKWDDKAAYMSRQLERPLALRRPGASFRASASYSGNALAVNPELALKLLNMSDTDQLDSLRSHWRNTDEHMNPVETGYRLRNEPVINTRSFEEENIVTIIPGRDKELAGEVLVVSAHYDHMGRGEPDHMNDYIYNGADDNASGTAVVMQVAEAFRMAAEKGYYPSRTIIFLHVAAEEWGLHGSRYYVQNSFHNLEDIVANINVDMVGYVDNEYEGTTDPYYIYVIGAGLLSSGLETLLDEANEASAGLYLDQKYNSFEHPSSLIRRSDQWAFGERDIPFVFFFSGLHDYYHTPSDTSDRIAWPLLAVRAELVTEYIWRLAEAEKRPVPDRMEPGTGQQRSR